MRCKDCHRFDSASEICKDGKLNPRHYSQAIEVAQQFGPRVICIFNDYREQVIESFAKNELSPKKSERGQISS